MTIGENIKKARKEAGVTQKELARRLNVTPSTVSQFEHSDNLNNKTVERIATALNLPTGFFFLFDTDNGELLDSYRGIYLVNNDIIKNLNKLNAEGKSKVLNYTKDLIDSGKYAASSDEPEE